MELTDYLRILRAHWLGILLIVVTCSGLAYGYTATQPKLYTATTSGFVLVPSDNPNTGYMNETWARSKVKSFVDIGSWRTVADFAIAELGLTSTPEQLVNRVSVSAPADTSIIHVSATASSPEAARDLAQAWVRGMQTEIDNLEGDGTPGSAPVQLQPGDSARLPSSPSSPNMRMNMALGLLAGMAIAFGYALVRHTLDRRLRTGAQIEQFTGTSVLGSVPEYQKPPRLAFGKNRGRDRNGAYKPLLDFATGQPQDDSLVSRASAEAIRELRTNLQFVDVDNPPRSIVVTSAMPADGKTTTVANLAISLAASGQKVILVDADLRRPRLIKMFGLPKGPGLTEVLVGTAKVTEVVHQVPGAPNLLVLSSGTIPPNPSELLASTRMAELIKSLSAQALVLIDTPPVLPVTDAALLATRTDGALIVVSAGKTNYEMLERLTAALDRTKARRLGFVLNRVPLRGANASPYDYQYRDYYTATR